MKATMYCMYYSEVTINKFQKIYTLRSETKLLKLLVNTKK